MDSIHDAVESLNVSKVRQLCEDSPDIVNATTDEGDTPLHLAAWQNSVEITQLLLQKHANINAKGDLGRTPLHCASIHDAGKVVPILLKHGADVNAKDDTKFTPLLYSARQGTKTSYRIANALRKYAAVVDLNSAICLGDVSFIREKFAKGSRVLDEAIEKEEVLRDAIAMIGAQFMAAQSKSTPEAVFEQYGFIVKTLLEWGLNPEGSAKTDFTLLMEAVQMPHGGIAKLLLEHGANANAKSGFFTPLKLCKASSIQDEMKSILRKFGAD